MTGRAREIGQVFLRNAPPRCLLLPVLDLAEDACRVVRVVFLDRTQVVPGTGEEAQLGRRTWHVLLERDAQFVGDVLEREMSLLVLELP